MAKAVASTRPGTGTCTHPGSDPGTSQRERLKPAASGTTSCDTMTLTGEMGEFCEGSHIPVQAAAQLPSLHAHFRSDLRHRTGSCAVERRAAGHWLGPGMPSPVLACRPGSQSHISETRSLPAVVGTLRKGPPLPLSAEAVQNFTFLLAALWPEHPRAGLQLIRDQGGYVEPGRAGCSIPRAPAHLHPLYGSASATAASLPQRQEEGCVSPVSVSLTLEMESGMLKSFPPCSLKPQGAGPFSITL